LCGGMRGGQASRRRESLAEGTLNRAIIPNWDTEILGLFSTGNRDLRQTRR
jgi:hypothetical protein